MKKLCIFFLNMITFFNNYIIFILILIIKYNYIMDKQLTFDFTKPIKKHVISCYNERSKEAAGKQINKIIDQYNKIAPVKELKTLNITDKSLDTEFEEYKINKQIISNYSFTLMTPSLINELYKLKSCTLKILAYIGSNLEYNTNLIELNTNEICKIYNITTRTFYSAVFELDKHNIVWRTNKHSIYVINPFMLYKGSLIRWYKNYLDKFNGMLARTNEKGIIILDD